MVEPVAFDPRRTYELASTAFQLALGAIILASGVRPTLRAGLAVILLANAYEAADPTLRAAKIVPESLSWLSGHLLDPLIVITTAFVLCQLPVPLGGRRGERISTLAWVAALVAWVVAAVTISPDLTTRAEVGKLYSQLAPFLLAGYLFAFHVVPRWRALPPGPLRGQVLLLAAAFGASLGAVGFQQALNAFRPGGNDVREALTGLVFAFIAIGVAQLALDAARGRRDAALFASLPLVGVCFAATDVGTGNNLTEYAAQVVRPTLIGAAVLRYDLVETSAATRRLLVPASVVAFVLALFFGLNAALTGQSATVQPSSSAAALVIMAVGALLLRRPIASMFRVAGGEAGSVERIERYRLALEAGGAPHVSAKLVELRHRLRITDEEHDTLVAVLQRHVVVPTRAIRGLQVGDRVGQNEVLRELGRGGQGRALLARSDEGALVVLKEIARPWEEGAEERAEALAREAEAGAKIRSPRVAPVRGVIEDAGIRYLARNYVAGRTLDAVVAEEGPLAPARASAVLVDVLEGVQAIHDAGLLHLDLKPSNVVLDGSGRAVIIDLGTARREAAAVGGATLTQGAAPGGTLGWMAPEQAAGERVGRAADVYGAGALLAFLLTGSKPSPAGVRAPGGALGAVVERACASDPGMRFQDARSMRETLPH